VRPRDVLRAGGAHAQQLLNTRVLLASRRCASRATAIFSFIEPSGQPHHTERNEKHQRRRQQHVDFQELDIGIAHSRSFPSAILPTRCKPTAEVETTSGERQHIGRANLSLRQAVEQRDSWSKYTGCNQCRSKRVERRRSQFRAFVVNQAQGWFLLGFSNGTYREQFHARGHETSLLTCVDKLRFCPA
jgi:hypothetical protein